MQKLVVENRTYHTVPKRFFYNKMRLGGKKMDVKSDILNEERFSQVIQEIYAADKAGLHVFVDGRIYSGVETDNLSLMMEKCDYMKSYTSDEHGKIVRIDFDHIGAD